MREGPESRLVEGEVDGTIVATPEVLRQHRPRIADVGRIPTREHGRGKGQVLTGGDANVVVGGGGGCSAGDRATVCCMEVECSQRGAGDHDARRGGAA